MTSCVSRISPLANCSVGSLREKSSGEKKRAWTPSTQFGLRRLESAFSSVSLTRERRLAESLGRAAAARRARHICGSGERSTGMAVEETLSEESMDAFVEVVHKLADAARVITLKYFRSKFQIIDKADLSERTSLCTLFLSLRGLCSKLSSNPRI
jgi:hypothetical protein